MPNSPDSTTYDALVVISFGGPEGREDVIPFLENVLRGRNVPRERMLEAAEHYYRFGGESPLNDQNRALVRALEKELAARGPSLPVYWGNRNWHPLLADTLRRMADDGVRRALAFVTSAYSSYSSCRQYLDDIELARAAAGGSAPVVDKIRAFFNHPGFIGPMIENTLRALGEFPAEERRQVELVFTAHSIPLAMAAASRYVEQLEEASRLVAEGARRPRWRLVYQSRSGPPGQPWLEPDIRDCLRELHGRSAPPGVVVTPIGFLSDHMEVLYDLDTEARQLCRAWGWKMVRAATVGVHPSFVAMIRTLVNERMEPASQRAALGDFGPSPDFCRSDCCPRPRPPARPPA